MVPGFSQSAGVTLHMENIYGDNHHIIESCFKGLARTLRSALEIDQEQKTLYHLLKAHYKS